MDIRIDRESAVPIYLQISSAIRDLILAGTLPEGFRLPPERRLASALGVNRSTVLSAYHELKASALVDAHVGRGTSVAPRPGAAARVGAVRPLPWRQFVRDGAVEMQDPLLRDLLALAERQDVTTFSVGLPAAELLPLETVRSAVEELAATVGPQLLLHSPTEGVTQFREALGELMSARGIQRSAAEVLVTSGSQQGLDLAARTFLSPGDAVVVEEPSFFGAIQVFRRAQARLLGVPADREGMRTDVLEALLARQRPKLIYTLPTFQNPSGAVMSLERRHHLLELAYRFQVPVLEDDPYYDLRYEGEPVPPLAALDQHGYVIYLSSFSKVLFPGLRLGWLSGARPAVRQLALAKQSMDLHSSTAGQFVLDRLVRGEGWQKHLETVRAEYALRRDAMHAALTEEAPSGVSWTKPQGGFYFWCRLPDHVRQSQLLARAAEQRVSYLPGDACFPDEPPANHLRLNFTFPPPEEIRPGIARLMGALRAAARRPDGDRHRGEATPPIV